jgi:hypothetical protein
MSHGKFVTSPDGERWRVRRRWMDRPLPDLRKRFRDAGSEQSPIDAYDGFWTLDAIGDSGWTGVAIAIATFLFILVFLPLLGVAFELVIVLLIFASGVASRVVLGRPWTVEAINLGDGARSAAYEVKGFGRAGKAVDELAASLAASGPPDRLSGGRRI